MEYQPKTGAKCRCKRGVQRDNCPQCEGTGMVIDFAAIRARRTVTVTRYVVTHVATDGMRTLTFPCQGRYTHSTAAEAQASLDLFNGPGGLAKVLTPDQLATLAVRAVECYAGHYDPTRVYFD